VTTNVLITGATGFVGPVVIAALQTRHPAAQLVAGYYVPVPEGRSRLSEVRYHFLDLLSMDNTDAVVAETRPDWIVHLAGQASVGHSWKYPNTTLNINVIGTVNLLDSTRRLYPKARILMIGSSEEYGLVGPDPIPETAPLDPRNFYAVSKVAQEHIASVYHKAYGTDIVSTRSFNHVGAGQDESYVIPSWCSQLVAIERGHLEPRLSVGNLGVERDFSHVQDIANSYIDLLERGISGQIYNVGSGIAVSLKVVLERLLSLTSIEIKVVEDPDLIRPSDNPIVVCDRSKLDAICPRDYRSLDDMLADTLEYWRKKDSNESK